MRRCVLSRGVAPADEGRYRDGMMVHGERANREAGTSSLVTGQSSSRRLSDSNPKSRERRTPQSWGLAATDRNRRRPLPLVDIVALVVVAFGLLRHTADAQYNPDTPLYEENMDKAEADLIASLEGGEYVEDVFYPERQVWAQKGLL